MSRYTITASQVENGILHLRLSPEQGNVPSFAPGQYASLSFAKNGRLTPSRCFSIVSAPDEGALEFGIRVLGSFTRTVAGLELGTAASVQGPFGQFVLDPNDPKPIVLLAAGIGITPFVSMLRAARGTSMPQPTALVYCVRSLELAPFRAEIDLLATQITGLRVIYFVSEAEDNLGSQRNVVAGQFSADWLNRVVQGRFANYRYYLCGPPGFMKTYIKALKFQGVEEDQIYSESFTQAVKLKSGWSIPGVSYGLTAAALVVASVSVMTLDLVSRARAQAAQMAAQGIIVSTPTPTLAPTPTPAPGEATPAATSTPTSTPTPTPTPVRTYYQPPVSSVS